MEMIYLQEKKSGWESSAAVLCTIRTRIKSRVTLYRLISPLGSKKTAGASAFRRDNIVTHLSDDPNHLNAVVLVKRFNTLNALNPYL